MGLTLDRRFIVLPVLHSYIIPLGFGSQEGTLEHTGDGPLRGGKGKGTLLIFCLFFNRLLI